MGRFSSRENAKKLLNDLTNWDLDAKLQEMANLMQRTKNTLTEDEKAQLIAVNPELASDLSTKQDNQIFKVSEMAKLVKGLKADLQKYRTHTTFERNKDAIKEQAEWETIRNKSAMLKNMLDEYKRVGCLFPIDNDDIMFKASWFADKTNREFSQPASGNLDLTKKGNAKTIVCNTKSSPNLKEYNLFPHNPDPEDLTQGEVGDCFMHAGLYSVAKYAPDAIRDCMTLNPDKKSVTVRLYGREKAGGDIKPFYVSVPLAADEHLTEGSMWTVAMETALAASGLTLDPRGVIKGDDFEVEVKESAMLGLSTKKVNRKMSEVRADIVKYTPSLIPSGDPAEVSECLFGERIDWQGREIAKIGMPRTKDLIKKYLDEGNVVTCGSRDLGDDTQKDSNGINYHHYYAIDSMDDTGFTLRNPHNDKDRINEKEETFHITFDQFKESMKNISLTGIPERFKQVEPPANTIDSYRTIVQNLTNSIGKQDSLLRRLLFNSSQFNELKDQLKDFNAMLQSEASTQADINKGITSLLNKVSAYEQRCTEAPRTGKTRECRMDITKGIRQICTQMKAGMQKEPTAEFNRFKTELAAEKVARGINNHFKDKIGEGQGMKKEDFLKMPLFKNMIKDAAELDNMCFNSPSTKVKDMMQGELKKAQQEITAEKFAGPAKVAQNQKSGPEINQIMH